MVDCGIGEYAELFDWGSFLNDVPDELDTLFDHPSDGSSNSADSGCSLSIDEIEQFLLKEDELSHDDNNVMVDEFFTDVFVDSPPEIEVTEDEKVEEKSMEDHDTVIVDAQKPNVVGIEDHEDEDDDDKGPAAKKRKRQMKNRDSAMRSRERKKSLVKDLELKSKYYEAECNRLGAILQCCLAENQALRLSLHTSKAFHTSMSKQESAVLFLESLLLGSLLGFLGIIYLLILPSQLLLNLEACLLENGGSVGWPELAPRKTRNEVFRILALESFMMSKTCKGSRSRIKHAFLIC